MQRKGMFRSHGTCPEANTRECSIRLARGVSKNLHVYGLIGYLLDLAPVKLQPQIPDRNEQEAELCWPHALQTKPCSFQTSFSAEWNVK